MKIITAIVAVFSVYILYTLLPTYVDVAHVQDGDTIAVDYKGDTEYVRLEGVDAPETDECYGRQATARLRHLINDTVELQKSDEDRGYYNRLIRYVHVDREDAGAALIQNGYARASDFDHPRYDTYKQLESDAKNSNLGLWQDCHESIWEE